MALSKITNDLLNLGADTSSLNLPKGTTAQRPSSPVAGMVRENTDDNVIEYYNGTEWKQVLYADVPPIIADYLVVAGGGASGYFTGGGGAGGYLTGAKTLTKSAQYVITVGAGGSAGTGNFAPGTNGENSVFNDVTSIGGASGTGNATGIDGGSGGGTSLAPYSGGSGTSGQGNNGGSNSSGNGGSGGGGAGTAGSSNNTGCGGNGGDGLQSSITGTATYYAGGGGGCFDSYDAGCNTPGTGGLGGGGNGGSVDGIPGTSNTGGGAGGGSRQQSPLAYGLGAAGGSGVVILRLLTSQYSGTTTGSPTVTTDGNYTVLTYTSSGTYTA